MREMNRVVLIIKEEKTIKKKQTCILSHILQFSFFKLNYENK